MPSAGDTPGWQPDPERPGMLRWWNGLGWSDARRAPDERTERSQRALAESHRVSTVTAQQVARTQRLATSAAPVATPGRTVGRNTLGAVAIALGIVGLVFGFGGVLSLIALLVALRGIARSRRLAAQGAERTGLAQSLAALLISIAGLVHGIPGLIALIQQLGS